MIKIMGTYTFKFESIIKVRSDNVITARNVIKDAFVSGIPGFAVKKDPACNKWEDAVDIVGKRIKLIQNKNQPTLRRKRK